MELVDGRIGLAGHDLGQGNRGRAEESAPGLARSPLKRLPNSVSREESTSDVSVRFYQAPRWDLDQIRDVITPRIMQYSTDQALIDRLVEFDDAIRNLNHAIIVHKEVLTHSGEVANRWTDERTQASDRPLLGRFLRRRGSLGLAQPAGSQTNRA